MTIQGDWYVRMGTQAVFFFFVHVLLIKCLSSSDINTMVYHREDVGKFHLSLGDVILKSLSHDIIYLFFTLKILCTYKSWRLIKGKCVYMCTGKLCFEIINCSRIHSAVYIFFFSLNMKEFREFFVLSSMNFCFAVKQLRCLQCFTPWFGACAPLLWGIFWVVCRLLLFSCIDTTCCLDGDVHAVPQFRFLSHGENWFQFVNIYIFMKGREFLVVWCIDLKMIRLEYISMQCNTVQVT